MDGSFAGVRRRQIQKAAPEKTKAIILVWMMADFFASLWLTPPSSAGASSYEDKANSYTYERYSAALQSQVATPRIGDGDARHIAMESIRMGQGKSISPINSYAKSNKRSLWKKGVGPGFPLVFRQKRQRRDKAVTGKGHLYMWPDI